MFDEIDETFGSDARCFIGEYQKFIKYPDQPDLFHKQAECHRVNCVLDDGDWIAEVYFSNQVVRCPSEGGRMVVGVDLKGFINCPRAEDLCRTFEDNICPLNCSNRGRCKEGECICYPGWTGDLCEFGLKGPNACIFPIDG
jgi:hypothetical protein